MRALSIRQPWAELIAAGKKKIEYRTWARSFRGDLLVVASAGRYDDDCRVEGYDPDALVYGRAVCVVDFHHVTGGEGEYEWHFRNPRRVEPVPITGYASIYNVDDGKVRFARIAKAPTRIARPRKKASPRRRAARSAPLVIVVMREERSRKSVAAALGEAGYRVKAARDSLAGWQLLASAGSDAAAFVLDANVSGLTVTDILERLKADAAFAKTRIVLTSSATNNLRTGITHLRTKAAGAVVKALGSAADRNA